MSDAIPVKSAVDLSTELINKESDKFVEIYCPTCKGWTPYLEGISTCQRCQSPNVEASMLSEGMRAARKLKGP